MAISIPRPAEAARTRSVRSVAFIGVGSVFVVAVLLFAVSRSPLVALRHVRIEGAHHRTPADVAALAGVPLGTNVVWLDTAAVARRIESDPWIASARVTRELPWSIGIAVTERTPIAVLSGGRRGTLLAADGALLGPAPAHSRLPVITLPPAAPATIGMPGEGGAVRALDALSPNARHRVREMDVGIGGTVTAVLREGTRVAFGPAVDLEVKATTLRRLLAWERTTGTRLGTISLVAPTSPAATLAR